MLARHQATQAQQAQQAQQMQGQGNVQGGQPVSSLAARWLGWFAEYRFSTSFLRYPMLFHPNVALLGSTELSAITKCPGCSATAAAPTTDRKHSRDAATTAASSTGRITIISQPEPTSGDSGYTSAELASGNVCSSSSTTAGVYGG